MRRIAIVATTTLTASIIAVTTVTASIIAVTTVTASIIAMAVDAPVASADPPVQPQAGAACDIAGLNTQTFANPQSYVTQPDVLMCVKGDQGLRWAPVDGIQRPLHNWITYGPTQTLHPDDVIVGEFWDGVPVTMDSICVEEQTFPTGGDPETKSNNTGQYFGFTLSPNMTSLRLKGYCTWQLSPCFGRTGPCTAGLLLPEPGSNRRVREA
jgi:hypothetical protein